MICQVELCCMLLILGPSCSLMAKDNCQHPLFASTCENTRMRDHYINVNSVCRSMLWSAVAQLRRGQLRIRVYVVDSCWWCDQLSVQTRHTHMMQCPPVSTSSWMICTDRPQFVVCLRVGQCCLLRSSPSMPSPIPNTWRCTCMGGSIYASHSCFHAAAIHSSLERSSGIILYISLACCKVDGTWVYMEAL